MFYISAVHVDQLEQQTQSKLMALDAFGNQLIEDFESEEEDEDQGENDQTGDQENVVQDPASEDSDETDDEFPEWFFHA